MITAEWVGAARRAADRLECAKEPAVADHLRDTVEQFEKNTQSADAESAWAIEREVVAYLCEYVEAAMETKPSPEVPAVDAAATVEQIAEAVAMRLESSQGAATPDGGNIEAEPEAVEVGKTQQEPDKVAAEMEFLGKKIEKVSKQVRTPTTKIEKRRNQRNRFSKPRRKKEMTWEEIYTEYAAKYPDDKKACPDTLRLSFERNPSDN